MDVLRLRRKILRNRLCSTVFRLDRDVYVVGGYLRDLILKGVHSKDIDFAVVRNLRQLATSVAEALGGSVVELKKERMTRVALKGGITLDFSRIQGEILEDLESRDFTINAMAWSPAKGLLDPLDGIGDMRRGVIRSVSDGNLKQDPLRLLRAFRFEAELGMHIDRSTKASIRRLSGRIRQSASERITLEFFRLLNSGTPSKSLAGALATGVLKEIIPLNNKSLYRNIKSISLLDSNLKKLHERLYVKKFSQDLTVRGLLRLEAVMLGANLSESRLSMSGDVGKRVETAGRLYQSFKSIKKLDRYALYDLFDAAGDTTFDLIVLSGRTDLLSEYRKFERIQKVALLKTSEVIAISGVGEGPRLGRILVELKRRRFARDIRSKRDSIRWLKELNNYKQKRASFIKSSL